MDWTQIAIALFTGGVLTALIKGFFNLVSEKLKLRNAFPETIRKIHQIYVLLDELKSEVKCSRVLLMCTKNGGGIPRPGTQLFATVLYETYENHMSAVMPYWRNRQIDKEYVKVLSGIEEQGLIVIKTKDLQDGLLKEIYTNHGIQASIITKVKATKERYYYISCNFTDLKDLTHTAKMKILDKTTVIKDII